MNKDNLHVNERTIRGTRAALHVYLGNAAEQCATDEERVHAVERALHQLNRCHASLLAQVAINKARGLHG